MQDEMTDLMDVSNEIQETLGRSYNIPDDVDEEELMGGMEILIDLAIWQFYLHYIFHVFLARHLAVLLFVGTLKIDSCLCLATLFSDYFLLGRVGDGYCILWILQSAGRPYFLFLYIAELDALEADMEFESAAVPSYLQPESDFDTDLNLPAAPTRPAAVPSGRIQVKDLHIILNLTS
jgi:hypothetical protein